MGSLTTPLPAVFYDCFLMLVPQSLRVVIN